MSAPSAGPLRRFFVVLRRRAFLAHPSVLVSLNAAWVGALLACLLCFEATFRVWVFGAETESSRQRDGERRGRYYGLHCSVVILRGGNVNRLHRVAAKAKRPAPCDVGRSNLKSRTRWLSSRGGGGF